MNLEDLNFDILKNFKLDSGELTFNFLINGYIEEKLMKSVYDEDYDIKEFIYFLIYQPTFSFADFEIEESEIELILRSFVEENPDFFNDFDYSNENFFEEFKLNIKRTIDEREKVIQEIIDNEIKRYNKIVENLYPTTNMMNELIRRNSMLLNTISLSTLDLLTISPVMDSYLDKVSEISNTLNHVSSANKVTIDAISNIKPILPISLIKDVSLTQNTLNNLYNSLNLIDWESINRSLTFLQNLSNIPNFNIIYSEKEEFALNLYNQIEEIDDNEELKTIFSLDFLLSLTDGNWWIIPRFSKEEYLQLSSIENINSNIFNQIFIGRYYENPELFYSMIQEWDLTDIRKKIISQAYINYIYGNYEACVIILMLQIEGILKENISMKKSAGKLRQHLEKQLNNNQTINSWDTFLNKANIQYVWMVLKPLYEDVGFNADEGIINRHNIAHIGIVEANQLIAIRFFLILDTLLYIFKSIDN